MNIDHRQLALDALEASSESRFGDINDREVARAQVHATLAVAEQARIRSLIDALGGTSLLTDEGWYSSSSTAVIDRIKERNSIRAAIREGLGV